MQDTVHAVKCENLGWGDSRSGKLPSCPHSILLIPLPFNSYPWFTNKDYLYQQYVQEGKSANHISRDLKCTRSTVIKYLLDFDIPLRSHGLASYRKSQLAYGEKLHNGKVEPHLGEMRVIKELQKLRDQGLSFGKLVVWLKQRGIRTKNGSMEWDRRTIWEILRRHTVPR